LHTAGDEVIQADFRENLLKYLLKCKLSMGLYLYSYGETFQLISVHSEHSLVAGFVCPGWPLFFWKEATVGMPRTLGHIARLDRRWFRAHPERRHRCRWPDTIELDLCDCDNDALLVMAVRHLGRGHIVYQPVMGWSAPRTCASR
jgi:hypothetical protein